MSDRATVPDSSYAVASCVKELDQMIPKKLPDYQNYRELSAKDRDDMLWWARRLHPQVLMILMFLGVFVDGHTVCDRRG